MTTVRAAIDRVVWRIPSPSALQAMEDLAVEQLLLQRAGRRRPLEVLAAEVDRRDAADKRRRQQQERQAKARARRRADREEFDLWIHSQWLCAEADCRGVLLNKAGVDGGIDPVSLFSGPEARAMKYASEELRNWWLGHPRLTLTRFKELSRETYDPTEPVAA